MNELVTTKADEEIEDCLKQKRSFSMIAGAGSGKTTSLIGCLQFLKAAVGDELRRDNKKIVCITYTNRAVNVISSRLEWDEIFYVSTLHKFLWDETGRFTSSIRNALRDYVIPNHIKRNQDDDRGGQSKKAVAAREKIRKLETALQSLGEVTRFYYNDSNFSDYAQGLLSHDDVIELAAHLITNNDNLRRILGQKYPYIMVDEAQDTFHNVVEALNQLCEGTGLPVIGYFGDPMQQIYDKRAGSFVGPEGSMVITKEENFRCSVAVIDFLNAFRKDVQQFPAGANATRAGSVEIRLVRAEEPQGPRKSYTDEQIDRASIRFTEALESWDWQDRKDVKWLFLVRQMIARRLGFPAIQKLFTGPYASSKAQDDYEQGEHLLLKPLVSVLCPLIQAQRTDDHRTIMDILRTSSPAFDPRGINATKTFAEMKNRALTVVAGLVERWESETLRDILSYSEANELCHFSDQLSEHIARAPRAEEYDADLYESEKGDWLADSLLGMPSKEIEAYFGFVNENTPLSTQHGVKGEEYNRVVVVFDDFEANWHNYSFTKTLTPNTSGSPTDGQYDRSQKLAYVCFSRAEEHLRILLFTPDPVAAKQELIAKSLLSNDQIAIAP